ncbi:hypothetical protein [Bradyrhizobium tropiciagri]|uniref:hypothetical protein n=1 Tax=Bradyrhizobium tropiciagri TaxID=312253 RepID=UPI00067D3967|nr:hypothetical protein [Bradyrhizobium tropiciagri]
MHRISLFLKSAGLTLAIIPLMWILSLGRYERAEHWLRNVYFVKERRAEQISGPKTLIVSGSNALFGFDSEALERIIGQPVVNLAGHAGLALSFHINLALKHAKAGDTVIMPLEFAYYAETSGLTSWQVANMQSWGARYVDWDLPTLVSYFRNSSFSTLLLRTLIRRIPEDPESKVLAAVERNSITGIVSWHGYSYRSMNARGDILVGEAGPAFVGPADYTRGELTQYALDQLGELKQTLEKRGARFLLTWPVSIRNEAFDLQSEPHRAIVDGLKGKLLSAGLPIICDAANFQFDRSLFLETRYHLGVLGAELRTEALAACLQHRPIDKSAAEARYLSKLR